SHALAAPDDTNHHAFDQHVLLLEIDLDGFEVFILGQQPDHGTFLPVAFYRYLVLEPRDDDLPVAHIGRAMHRDQITIEDAGILHAHAHHLQQVVRAQVEHGRIDLQVILD